MKVLGKDGAQGYIVHLEGDEMSKLMGFAYTVCEGFTAPKVGDTVDVSGIFDRLKRIAEMKVELDRCDKAAQAIIGAIAGVRTSAEVICREDGR